MKFRTAAVCGALLLVTLGAYANHFHNDFHFDDAHTITGNVFIESLGNIPRFFRDASMFSSEPALETWRPVTSTSLAIDYWLGHGRNPFFFHLSTFLWFELEIVLMFFLFRRIMDAADPHASNLWTAAVAAAIYAVHPANAETINYIIQRADLYNALGVVASLLWFAAYPAQRKYGLFLIPAVLAMMAKAPALIFPFILLCYIYLVERGPGTGDRGPGKSLGLAAVVTSAMAALTLYMTPATFHGGAASASLYRLTQPWIALHYFKCFFLPTDLSADTDWGYVSPFGAEAVAGYLFVIAILAAAWWTAKRRDTRPIAFGLLWFVLALVPTSLMPLTDVTNDHRMFFPFVGLALAIPWGVRWLLFRATARLTRHAWWWRAAVAAAAGILALAALGTWQRNQVWHTEESLWRDVTIKSPGNARGLMNYGLVFLNRGDFAGALPYLVRAEQLKPDYPPVQANLGITYGGLGRDTDAVRHFERALDLAGGQAEPHLIYSRWLKEKGRLAESQAQAEAAVAANPRSFPARNLLMEIYSAEGNREAADRVLRETVAMAFNEQVARQYMEERARREREAEAALIPANATPEALVNLSAKYCNNRDYEGCLKAARKAVEIRPGYAEAYNNMAAAYLAVGKWDEGIEAARRAIQLKPDYQAAKNNLEWGLAHRPKKP